MVKQHRTTKNDGTDRVLLYDDSIPPYEPGESLAVAIPYGRHYRLRMIEKNPTIPQLEALLTHLKKLNRKAV